MPFAMPHAMPHAITHIHAMPGLCYCNDGATGDACEEAACPRAPMATSLFARGDGRGANPNPNHNPNPNPIPSPNPIPNPNPNQAEGA